MQPHTLYPFLVESLLVAGNRRGPALKMWTPSPSSQREEPECVGRGSGMVATTQPRQLQSFAFEGSLRTTIQRAALGTLLFIR